MVDFDNAHLYLRGNDNINYEQLGLKFKLFSAEVLFNKGLSLIYMGRMEEGLASMQDAQREKQTDDHSVIDDAIADKGDGYTVFSIVSLTFGLLDEYLNHVITACRCDVPSI